MTDLSYRPHGYRDDPNVPPFDDAMPLFVFDGVCVLCSGGAAWIMRRDSAARVNFASAQSPLGQTLYRHYGIDFDETYLVLIDGRPFTKSAGYLRLCGELGGWWRIFRVAALIPRPLRDWVYDRVAANRYRWFGKTGQCALLTPGQRARLLG